jgi:hypothetical protein
MSESDVEGRDNAHFAVRDIARHHVSNPARDEDEWRSGGAARRRARGDECVRVFDERLSMQLTDEPVINAIEQANCARSNGMHIGADG